MLLDKEVPVVRATFAWIFTLIAGFSAVLGVATLVLLPIQAENNRVIYAKAERLAEKLVAGSTPPLYEDHTFPHQFEGVRFWHTPPGDCQDKALETSSDTLVVGFWDNGSKDDFGTRWWHCYAYPSGRTTLQLTPTSYFESGVGMQLLVYFSIVVFAGLVAWLLGSYKKARPLSLWAKAIWFTAFIMITGFFDAIQDFGDDEFHKMPDHIKWFDLAYQRTMGIFLYPIDGLKFLPIPLLPFLLFAYVWGIGTAISIAVNAWRNLKARNERFP